ncbi:MAG: BREX-2 system phosphatase PglZ [Planctomycetota bacterium]|nr:MAG: BREX-2 system phosphatase PglZ [Planctomycetota bacterium]
MSSPTAAQIVAQVRQIRAKYPQERIFGLRSARAYSGPSRVECGKDALEEGKEAVEVVQCDSPLAIRLALRQELAENTLRVLITSLDETDLGDDIRLRLPKRQLFDMDAWEVVLQLFRAREVDPELRRLGWMADKLLASQPLKGYQAAMAGYLGLETVWPQLLGECWGLREARADLPSLLHWSLHPEVPLRLRQTEPVLMAAAIDWLTGTAGNPARAVVELMGRPVQINAMAMGLVLGVLSHPEATGRLEGALTRLEERYFAGKLPTSAILHKWAAAATEAMTTLQQGDARQSRQVQERADALLLELKAGLFVHLSDATPWGLQCRLERLGAALTDRLQQARWKEMPTLEPLVRQAREHRLFGEDPRRGDRLDMALRLMRWLADCQTRPLPAWQSLAEGAAWHQREGGRLDWARRVLRAGDPVKELAEAGTLLAEAVARRQAELSRQFAVLLVDRTAANSVGPDLLGVEQVLDQVVAPLVQKGPVLLVVIDGMSAAVCQELLADLTRLDWEAVCPQGRAGMAPCLAVIPSATEFSRTSLLTGQLQQGNAATEQEGFRTHAGLVAASQGCKLPVLFHKAGLQGLGGIADAVRAAIEERAQRVVGVVLNAVDDHLLKGEQLNIHWERGQIRGLEILLSLARASGRTVVLCSDHGHILENQTEERAAVGGERWRVATGAPLADELEIRGARVLAEGGRLIAPTNDKVRFGGKKNGYHGGLTPQEMVAPVVVLHRRDGELEGWVPVPTDMPAWWDDPLGGEQRGLASGQARGPATAQGDLFMAPVPVAGPAAVPVWVKHLLKTEMYQQQLQLMQRNPPAADLVTRVLTALDEKGGKMTQVALARAISFAETRMGGLVANLQRLLNVDGYMVFDRDHESNTIELKRELLLRQFGLEQERQP